MKLLPGFTNAATNGFNMREADFLGQAIFELKNSEGKTILYGPSGAQQQYDVPDEFSISPTVTSYSKFNSAILKTKSDYDNTFSASLKGSYSSPTFSGSINSNLAFHGNLFQESETSYALNWDLQQTYSVERSLGSLTLTTGFKQAVGALETKLQAKTISTEDFVSFFGSYGTHILVKGGFGGYMTMETSIDDSLVESLSEKDISVGITAGYKGIINSGEISASVAVTNSTFLSKHTDTTSVSVFLNGGQRSSTIDAFFNSIFDLPILLLTNPNTPFQSDLISVLVEQAGGTDALKAKMEAAIEQYIDTAIADDGLIVSPQIRQFSQRYRPSHDGFLMTCIDATQNGGRGFNQSYAQKAPPVVQLEASASVHYFTASDTYVPWASSALPVKAGDYCRAADTSTSGTPTQSLRFVPLNINSFSEAVAIEVKDNEATVTPECDGFVYASIEAVSNGNRGTVEISQGSSSTGASMHYFEKSDTWVPKNSCCLPVRKGVPYKVVTTPTSGSPTFTVFYTAMNGDMALQSAIVQNEGTTVQAETDGFLVGFLNQAENGNRSKLAVRTCGVSELLKDVSPVARTSMHYFTGSDTIVPMNSVMVPIAKGDFYVCNIDNTSGKANHQIYFIPLTMPKQ